MSALKVIIVFLVFWRPTGLGHGGQPWIGLIIEPGTARDPFGPKRKFQAQDAGSLLFIQL